MPGFFYWYNFQTLPPFATVSLFFDDCLYQIATPSFYHTYYWNRILRECQVFQKLTN